MLESDHNHEARLTSLDEAQLVHAISKERGGARDESEQLRVDHALVGEMVTKNDDPREEALTGSEDPDEASKASENEHVVRALQSNISLMTAKVEQLEQQVLQVTRIRSTLKRTKSQSIQVANPLKDRDNGFPVNKKQRLFDAARNEAAKRRKMTEHVRLFANILRQLMQHKWAWPFMKPVDVEGLCLHDYFKVIRKPMDLGTIRNRLEAKDGSGYRHVREMCEDVRLVFRNAMLYNESWTDVHKMAKTLWQKFEEKWKMAIETKLIEEEEKSGEDQQEGYLLEIAELRAGEEQAAEQLGDDVFLQLTATEKKLEGSVMKLLSNCRTMRVDEKRELGRRLCQLPPPSLSRVIEIMSVSTDSNNVTDGKVQVDLEALDTPTLWRLHFFVKMVTQSRQEQAAVNTNGTDSPIAGPSHAV